MASPVISAAFDATAIGVDVGIDQYAKGILYRSQIDVDVTG